MATEAAQRALRIKPSPTLAVTARAQALRAEGRNIIGLGAGEPDFDTPDHVKNAAIDAIRAGFTKYTAVDGIADLKQAIVNKLARDNALHYSNNEILVSAGAKHSIYNLAQALLNKGDEVIIPAPYWVSYPDIALLADARPVIVSAGLEQNFKITPKKLAQAITPQTRLLILNSPSNPTGVAYTKNELAAIGEVLRPHPRVMIASDDIYEHIWWADQPFSNILNACPDLKERCIVINGVSKVYAMTGWRIGYAAGPAWLIAAMKKIQSQSTSNPTSIAQVAAQAALDGDQSCIQTMVRAFRERHDYVVKTLNDMDGVTCLPSQGAFYSFPNMQAIIERSNSIADDIELAEYFLNEAEVALVPGSAFGAPGYLRLSFATGLDTLREALGRIADLLNRTT